LEAAVLAELFLALALPEATLYFLAQPRPEVVAVVHTSVLLVTVDQAVVAVRIFLELALPEREHLDKAAMVEPVLHTLVLVLVVLVAVEVAHLAPAETHLETQRVVLVVPVRHRALPDQA
jgi:hypothetical protein